MKRLKPQAATMAAICVIAVCILANVALYAFRPFGHATETAPVSAEKGSAAADRSPEGESASDAEEATEEAVRADGPDEDQSSGDASDAVEVPNGETEQPVTDDGSDSGYDLESIPVPEGVDAQPYRAAVGAYLAKSGFADATDLGLDSKAADGSYGYRWWDMSFTSGGTARSLRVYCDPAGAYSVSAL